MVPAERRQGGWERWIAAGAVAVVALPILISVFSLIGQTWIPAGDEASILMRTNDVGTADTPLIGVYSTRGWAHPGPILYYLLAGPYRLFGGDPINLFQAAGLINVLSIALIGFLAWRRRGLAGTIVALAFTATLLVGMRSELLVQAWNPYIPLLMYFAFLIAVWSVIEMDWCALPLASGLASALVQMHVGYAPLVISAGALAGLMLFANWRRLGAELERPNRRTIGVTVGVVVALWLPPLFDQLFAAGNLLTLGRYFGSGETSAIGLSEGFGLLSGHTRLGGPWMGGRERVRFVDVQPESLAWLILLLVLLVGGVVRAYGRRPAAASLPVLALVQLIAAGFAASRVERPLLSYLIVWMLPLVTFCWFAVVFTAFETLDAWWTERSAMSERRLPHAAILGLVGLVGLLQTTRSVADAPDPPLPRQQNADAVASVVAQLDGSLDPNKVIRVEGVGDSFNEAWAGVVYELDARDVTFFTSDGAEGQKWTSDHAYDGQNVDEILTIATHRPFSFEDPVETCDLDPEQTRVAEWDPLSGYQRDRLKTLQIEKYFAEGRLPPDQAAELDVLSRRNFRLAAFAGPRICGGPR